MTIHRVNAKRDAVEPGIVQAIRRIGVTALRISGAGAPDLLTNEAWTGEAHQIAFLRRYGLFIPLEVKGAGARLTPTQKRERIADKWPVVHSDVEAAALYGVKA